MLKELVEYIIQQLVDENTPVVVTIKEEQSAVTIEVTIDAKERGRIIGRDGQTIKSLKAFLSYMVPAGTHIIIDLVPAAVISAS
jgi:predicted RNA-binding protein YlqC (UPF0109 family)